MIVTVRVLGARELAARWLRKVATLHAEIEVDLETNAQRLVREIQARAPYRTGRYRASWTVERGRDTRVVGSGEPYGRRLEYGFVGVDALGRNYSQAPQPHVNPAADTVEGPLVSDLAKTAVRGL